MNMNRPTVPHDRSAAAVGIDDDDNDKIMEDGQTVRTISTTDVHPPTGKRTPTSRENAIFADDGEEGQPPLIRRKVTESPCCPCTRFSTCYNSCACKIARKHCTTCACLPRCRNKIAMISSATGQIEQYFTAATTSQADAAEEPAPMDKAAEAHPATTDNNQQSTAFPNEEGTDPLGGHPNEAAEDGTLANADDGPSKATKDNGNNPPHPTKERTPREVSTLQDPPTTEATSAETPPVQAPPAQETNAQPPPLANASTPTTQPQQRATTQGANLTPADRLLHDVYGDHI